MLILKKNVNKYQKEKNNYEVKCNSRNISYIENYFLIKLRKRIENLVPNHVLDKVLMASKDVLNYFYKTNLEEVYLFILKEGNSWNIEFKVFPSYKKNIKKEKINKILKFNSHYGNKIFINLKDFYKKNYKEVIL